MSFSAIGSAFGALLLFILAVMVAVVLSSSSRVRSSTTVMLQRLPTWRARRSVPPAATSLLDKSAVVYGYLTGILALLLALLLMTVLSARHGREQAEREISDFRSGKGARATVTGRSPDLPVRSRLIICSERHCSFWTGTESVTVRLDAIERLLSAPAAGAASAASVAGTPPASAP